MLRSMSTIKNSRVAKKYACETEREAKVGLYFFFLNHRNQSTSPDQSDAENQRHNAKASGIERKGNKNQVNSNKQ